VLCFYPFSIFRKNLVNQLFTDYFLNSDHFEVSVYLLYPDRNEIAPDITPVRKNLFDFSLLRKSILADRRP
jgi:hypothetical protein